MDNTPNAADNQVPLRKPKSRLLKFRDRLLSPHLKEYRPHAAESIHQSQVLCCSPIFVTSVVLVSTEWLFNLLVLLYKYVHALADPGMG